MAESRDIAEQASFQAFVNCYLREVDAGRWVSARSFRRQFPSASVCLEGEQLLRLRLPGQQTVLLFDVLYRSEVGRHQIVSAFVWQNDELQHEGYWSVILLLVKELFHNRAVSINGSAVSGRLKHRQLELTHRLTDSLQNMTRYLEQRWQQPFTPPLTFCPAEQSLIFGHWLHPTPKSRQGILDWQHELLTPELQGEFQLYYFAVHRDLVEQRSVLPESAEWLTRQTLGEEADALDGHEVLVPTHPLQAQWLMSRPQVREWLLDGRLRELGPMGPCYRATSSVRTLYAPDQPWMFKLSLPVKITNSLRQNKNHELRAGVLMAGLLKKLAFSARFPQFQIILDPAYLTVKTPGGEESGFETIIRENPFAVDPGQPLACLAALVQDAWHPDQPASALKQLVLTQAAKEQRAPDQVALDWFEAYWRCAIEPCILLFDWHGIALEAHQQNSLLQLEDGYPTTYFYRDNQGFYLADNERSQLLQWQPELHGNCELFYPPEMIADRFGYYLIVNQLFSVVHRMGADQLVGETRLLTIVQEKLDVLAMTLSGNGRLLVERLLSAPSLPAKANLLTRVEDIDELEAELELASYGSINNPLKIEGRHHECGREVEYA